MTLTEFLVARIAVDEEAALAAGSGRWKHDGSWYLEGVEHEVVGPDEVAFTHPAYINHITRHDPARVLAECEAKRRIMELHPIYRGPRIQDVGLDTDFGCETCHTLDRVHGGSLIEALGYCDTLLALASVYSDHQDFREEWRL